MVPLHTAVPVPLLFPVPVLVPVPIPVPIPDSGFRLFQKPVMRVHDHVSVSHATQMLVPVLVCDRKVRDLEYIIVREGFHCS